MKRFFILLFLLPLFATAQSNKFPSKADLTKFYTRAIGDFIKAANKKNQSNFDSLFFIKRPSNQPDGFPDIELPETIENTVIKMIPQETGDKYRQDHPKRININLIGWVDKKRAEFLVVVFTNGFAFQYQYTILYKFNPKNKTFPLAKLDFTGSKVGK